MQFKHIVVYFFGYLILAFQAQLTMCRILKEIGWNNDLFYRMAISIHYQDICPKLFFKNKIALEKENEDLRRIRAAAQPGLEEFYSKEEFA